MRNSLLIFGLVFTSIFQAQSIFLPLVNSSWETYGAMPQPGKTVGVICTYFTDGDSIVNSFTYTKIRKIQHPAESSNAYQAFTGLIRQDSINHKIYVIPNDSANEQLLYDFKLNVSDTVFSFLTAYCAFKPKISLIDTININGVNHKRFHLTNECGNFNKYIEGIGSIEGLLFQYYSFSNTSNLTCFKLGNYPYYGDMSCINSITKHNSKPKDISVFPNPTSFTLQIIANNDRKKTCLVTNSLGNEVLKDEFSSEINLNLTDFPNGLYILCVIDNGDRIFKKILKL